MRKAAWGLLLLFAFAIPWEYSLDLGEPIGNVARVAGLLVLLVAIPAVLQAGQVRTPGPLQWAVLAFYLWFCCSYFWTIDQAQTLIKMRGYFQEMMTVWLVWELAESPRDLRWLLRASVAGAWVLALLTLADFASPTAVVEGQMRFAAYGQDPNDVARYLDLGFPIAALLLQCEKRWPARVLAGGYLPLGLIAVLLTASRGGFVAAAVALLGCAVLLLRSRGRTGIGAVLSAPVLVAAVWYLVPSQSFARLATIPEQIQSGGLNQRMNIWTAGWHAFAKSPLMGTGAGTFVSASGMSALDTAHNTVLDIVIGGGLFALFVAAGIFALTVRAMLKTRGALQVALATSLAVWTVSAMVSTADESRTTWLLIALIALAGRLAVEQPEALHECFPESAPGYGIGAVAEQTA
jgi:O-antigen ligase